MISIHRIQISFPGNLPEQYPHSRPDLVYVPTSKIHAHIRLSLTWTAVFFRAVFAEHLAAPLIAPHMQPPEHACYQKRCHSRNQQMYRFFLYPCYVLPDIRAQRCTKIRNAGRCHNARICFSSACALAAVSITTMSAPVLLQTTDALP